MVIYKKIITIVVLLFAAVFIISCDGIGIASYKYKSEDVKYIEEAMDEFFNKYPETHLTNEILIKLKHSHLHRYPKDSSRINNSLFYISATTENVRKFFW